MDNFGFFHLLELRNRTHKELNVLFVEYNPARESEKCVLKGDQLPT
jgi:hypothetical protein